MRCVRFDTVSGRARRLALDGVRVDPSAFAEAGEQGPYSLACGTVVGQGGAVELCFRMARASGEVVAARLEDVGLGL